jgi:hypothetical protein
VARGFDVSKNLPEVLKAAHAHKGAAFIEIFQNCIVYNKDVFDDFAAPKGAEASQLWLKMASRCCSAARRPAGSRASRSIATAELKVVDVVDGDWQAAGVIVHNVTNRAIAHMLVEMPFGPFPMALGVLYDDPRPTFEKRRAGQDAPRRARARKPISPSCSPRARPGRWRDHPRAAALDPAAAGAGGAALWLGPLAGEARQAARGRLPVRLQAGSTSSA